MSRKTHVHTYRIELHVYGYPEDSQLGRIEIWEHTAMSDDGKVPHILEIIDKDCFHQPKQIFYFELARVACGVAKFEPVVTHRVLGFNNVLERHGWKKSAESITIEDVMDFKERKWKRNLAEELAMWNIHKSPKEAAEAIGYEWTDEDQAEWDDMGYVSPEVLDNAFKAIKEIQAQRRSEKSP